MHVPTQRLGPPNNLVVQLRPEHSFASLSGVPGPPFPHSSHTPATTLSVHSLHCSAIVLCSDLICFVVLLWFVSLLCFGLLCCCALVCIIVVIWFALLLGSVCFIAMLGLLFHCSAAASLRAGPLASLCWWRGTTSTGPACE